MRRPPPPRWPPGQTWRPPVRPAFGPPPPRGFVGPPRYFPRPVSGFFPGFVAVRPPPRPRPPVVDAEQLWVDTFRRTHCREDESIPKEAREPPLRLLRRRVARAQMLAQQLSAEAADLAALELRLREAEQRPGDAAKSVEVPRLRVQRERKVAVCEALKKQLDEMNAASGLFPEKQLAEIRAFAARVKKKKAYRKRANVRRRAEASIRRAVDSNKLDKVTEDSNDKATCSTDHRNSEDKEGCEEAANSVLRQSDPIAHEHQITTDTTAQTSTAKENALDPKTLTIDTLIAVRRAWDSYIVYPQTPGASTIPPHFVPPPQAPSPQWAVYAAYSPGLGAAS